ncbi:MAG: hypothetical protein KA020_14540, partial [Planctomycetes bacterium]|nr:hypothetical protein [Planctomycetota bacterium]
MRPDAGCGLAGRLLEGLAPPRCKTTYPTPCLTQEQIMALLSKLRAFLVPTLLALTSVTASAQTYSGVGGRYGQQIGAITRNMPLSVAGSTSVAASGSNRRIFVRFLANTGYDVTGFDLVMKFGILGEVVPAWLYTANAQNQPANAVASGEIGISTNMRPCRASFRDKYRVSANTLYFIAFELPAGETLSLATAGSGATSVTWFVTSTGSARSANLQYAVNAGGYSPEITMTQPAIGTTMAVDCSDVRVGGIALLWLSSSALSYAIDWHAYGAPGSFFYLNTAGLSLLAVAPSENDRTRQVLVAIPNDPWFRG